MTSCHPERKGVILSVAKDPLAHALSKGVILNEVKDPLAHALSKSVILNAVKDPMINAPPLVCHHEEARRRISNNIAFQ